MGSLEKRLKKLEQQVRPKAGFRLIYFIPNLEPEEPEETPWRIKLSADIWAHVFGEPLNEEEIRDLRQECAEKVQLEFEAASRSHRTSN